MAEIRTVTTLRKKEAEIVRAMDAYEERLKRAQADLAHVRAIIRLFEATDSPDEITPYADLDRLYRYAEMGAICLEALKTGPLTTPQLGLALAKAKGFDVTDKALLHNLTKRANPVMHSLATRRKVVNMGPSKAKGQGRLCVWRLP